MALYLASVGILEYSLSAMVNTATIHHNIKHVDLSCSYDKKICLRGTQNNSTSATGSTMDRILVQQPTIAISAPELATIFL